MVEGGCDAWGRHDSDDTTIPGHDESAAAWNGYVGRYFDLRLGRAKNKKRVAVPRIYSPLPSYSLAFLLLVMMFPFILPSAFLDLPFFYFPFPPSFIPLLLPPLRFLFLIAFPASVLGMYFLGDGMDRDRFGGFGHDLALLLKSPLRFRVISQFPLISPSDLPPFDLFRHISFCLVKERIVPVPIVSRMAWVLFWGICSWITFFMLFFFSCEASNFHL